MNKKFFTIIAVFVFGCLIQTVAFAQETNSNKPAEWVRVESDAGEFSVEMPANFTYFYDKDGFNYDNMNQSYVFKEMRLLNASAEKTVMSVEIYKVSSPKKHLDELLERQRLNGTKTDESQDGFTIKQVEQTKLFDLRTKEYTEISFITRFIASKSYVYEVTVANRGAKSQAATRFLSSIRINKSGAASTDTTKVVNLSSLKPLTIQQIGEIVEEDKTKQAQTNKENQTTKPIEKTGNSILILAKPFAAYTNAARMSLTSGTIRLRVTFAEDGRISKIGVVSGLENGLTRNAFFAALRIKFIPQEKENEFVSATKTVEYSFSIGR